jgi:HNH endonuclease.
MKLNVYHLYGMVGPKDRRCIPDAHGRRCEIDHLIPRSLGGADHLKNLWPQPFGTKPWNAARKDRLEVRLSKDVCNGKLRLENARRMLVKDYRTAYRRLIGNP